jgi:hypothetical protein
MGYRGKVEQQERARVLRAQGWTYAEICEELDVARSSVSLWVRDVAVDPALLDERRRARFDAGLLPVTRRPSSLHLRKLAEIEECEVRAGSALGDLSNRDLFVAGIALYAGEGNKTGAAVGMANTNPAILAFFVRWLRTFFEVDESRLRVRLYLHQGLDLDAAEAFWADRLSIPREQFRAPYRAVADPTRRRTKHLLGCPSVTYSDSHHLRSILALIDRLLSSAAPFSPG